MGRVEGKIALITGAARGQGRSHALRLAEQGADIIALDVCADLPTVPYPLATEDELGETAAGVEKFGRRVVSARVDVRDADRLDEVVSKAVSELGGLDIVSVNAGICGYGQVLDLTADEWNEMIDVNLTGSFNTAKATIPHILAQGRGGSVIFTSSIGGLEAIANIGHYNASKFGVIGLMKTLALELGEQGVRVNAVCPGNVNSPMMHNAATYKLFFPDLDNPGRADVEAPDSRVREGNTIPVPYVDMEDITHAVMYLASDEARYVTGTTLVVDAGRMLK